MRADWSRILAIPFKAETKLYRLTLKLAAQQLNCKQTTNLTSGKWLVIDLELCFCQEFVILIRKLCVDLGSGLEEADKLISNVTVTLTDTRSQREVRDVMFP